MPQVHAHRDTVALRYEAERYTYARVRRPREPARPVADRLAASAPESSWRCGYARSLDLVVGIHAVIAAGGAYVPLDPTIRRERTEYILGRRGAGAAS